MFWLGTTSERGSGRCVGWVQGLSLGTKGRANVWISHRNALSGSWKPRSTRGSEEHLPWHDLYDSLRETDEQTYFDLRLVCLVILSKEVVPRPVMFQ